MDELLPPIIRDNKYFMYPFYKLAYWGSDIKEVMDFKKNIYSMTDVEYEQFYQKIKSISRYRDTDLNHNCIVKILDYIKKESPSEVADIGCGNGYMLEKIAGIDKDIQLIGVDLFDSMDGDFKYVKSKITDLPFADNSIDTVICSHVIEHILDANKAVEELIRITRHRLIIIVPKQRYYYYTLDEHVNFYQQKEQVAALIGVKNWQCDDINGDWFYTTEKNKQK